MTEGLIVLEKLHDAGYEAYFVGGCVRDKLLGVEPHDWDICTNAKPTEVKAVFQGFNVLDTGLKHGTVTVMVNGEGYEVTTYREDGDYTDGRHPDSVVFSTRLEDDLKRRDFTVNAMALSPDGVQDFFGGKTDLEKRVIRCVGNPFERFSEDKLRILRALRFASVLGFTIEAETLRAMETMAADVPEIISAERISTEFHKMVCGKYFSKVMKDEHCLNVFMDVFPEFKPMRGFVQNNPHHCFDVWNHTLVAVDYADTEILKLAAIFHDMGKPVAYVEKDGVGHFYGHAELSAEMANEFMLKYRFSNDEREQILTVVSKHHYEFPANKKSVLRALNKLGPEALERIVAFRTIDVMAQSDYQREEKLAWPTAVKEILDNLDDNTAIYKTTSLAVSGDDLKDLGYQEGPIIGKVLKRLLEAVMNGECPNEKENLLERAKKELD